MRQQTNRLIWNEDPVSGGTEEIYAAQIHCVCQGPDDESGPACGNCLVSVRAKQSKSGLQVSQST